MKKKYEYCTKKQYASVIMLVLVTSALVLATVAPSFAEVKTITYWSFIDPNDKGPRGEAQTRILKQFEVKHPDVKVEVEVMQWQKITPMLITAAKAKKGPDLVRVFHPDFKTNVSAGTLASLDKYTAKWSEKEKNDWVIPWDATVVNGKKYALFSDTRVRLLWYRQDLLDQAGLQPPKTLQEMATIGQKVANDRVAGVLVAVSSKSPSSVGERILPLLYGAGGKLTNADGTAAFNSNAGVKIYQWIEDLIIKYKAMPAAVAAQSNEDQYQAFLTGNACFLFEGSHRVVDARKKSGLGNKFQTMSIPSFDLSRPSPSWTTGWVLGIGANSNQKDLAWELMRHITSRESQLLSTKVAGELPAIKSVLDDPWFDSVDGREAAIWLKYASDYPLVVDLPETWAFLTNVLAQAAEEMIVRKVPPKEALDKAAEKYNAGIRKSN